MGEAIISRNGSSSGNSGVGLKTSTGGEIFNDYINNKSLGEFSHSEGLHALAGSMAFTILALDSENKTYTLDSVEGLEIGDVYSVYLYYEGDKGNHKENVGKIESIDTNTNTVTVDIFHIDDGRVFTTLESYIDEFGVDDERNTFRIVDKPLVGTRRIGFGAHAEGREAQALSKGAHAENDACIAYGSWAHAEGKDTKAGYGAHAEGKNTAASGFHSHAEGTGTTSSGWAAHAEGCNTIASNSYSHAEGNSTQANGLMSHAEGQGTVAEGLDSHAEGKNTLAKGNRSHAEGLNTEAQGDDSHVGGIGTKATATAQTAVGKYNAENPDALYIVGNGTSDTKRNNAFVVYKDGTAEIDKQGNTDKSVVTLKHANDTYANAYKISEEKDIVIVEDASSVATSSIAVVNNAGKSVTLSDAKFVKADIVDEIDFNSEESVLDNFTKVETSKYTFDLAWNEDDSLYLYNNISCGTNSYIYRDIEVEANSDYCLSFDFRQISTDTNSNTSFGVFGINDDGTETQFERIDNIVTEGIGYITNSSITINNSTTSIFKTSVTKTNHYRYINTTGGTGLSGEAERAKMTFSTGPFTKIRIKYYPNGVDRNCYISNWRIFKMTEIEGLSINSDGSLSLIPDKGVYATDTAGLDINYNCTKDTKALIDNKADKDYVDEVSAYAEANYAPYGYVDDNFATKQYVDEKFGFGTEADFNELDTTGLPVGYIYFIIE